MTDRRREKRRNLILDTKIRPWTVWGRPRQGPGVKGVPVNSLSWVLRFEECGSTLGKEGRKEGGRGQMDRLRSSPSSAPHSSTQQFRSPLVLGST